MNSKENITVFNNKFIEKKEINLNNNEKLVLGLDIGISSLGWAVSKINTINSKKSDIIDFGVRLWDLPEVDKTNDTLASARRNYRSSRRSSSRKNQRIKDLKKFLEKNKIIKTSELNDYLEKSKIKGNKQLDIFELRLKGLTKKLTPLEFSLVLINLAKRRGYSDKFSALDSLTGKDKSEHQNKIDLAHSACEKYGTPIEAIYNDESFKNSRGQLLSRNYNLKNEKGKKIIERDKSHLFIREDYKKEFDKLLEKQSKFYSSLNKKNIGELKNNIVYRQRDFEDGPGPKDKKNYKNWEKSLLNAKKSSKHLIRKSFIESIGEDPRTGSKRGHKLSIYYDLFLIINEISKLTSNIKDEKKLKELNNKIIDNYFNLKLLPNKKGYNNYQNDFNYKNIVSLFKELDLVSNKKGDAGYNLKTSDLFINKLFSTGVKDSTTLFDQEQLKKEFFKLKDKVLNSKDIDDNLITIIGNAFYENITQQRLREKLSSIKNIKLNIDVNSKKFGESVKIIQNSKSPMSVSNEFVIEAIKVFLDSKEKFGEFLYKKDSESIDKILEKSWKKSLDKKDFFLPINDHDMSKNATVYRAINQTRKIVKALHSKYIHFDSITIEVSRDLYNDSNERDLITSINKYNQKQRQEAIDFINENNSRVTEPNIERYQLWKMQKGKDLYSNKEINAKDIFSPKYQVDHIIPYSKHNDNSKKNKVLTSIDINQKKLNTTGMKYVESTDDKKIIDTYNKFINTLLNASKPKSKEKIYEYKLKRSWAYNLMTKNIKDNSKDFDSNNINDNRYITKYFTKWIKTELKNYNEYLYKHILKQKELKETKVVNIQGSVTSQLRRNWLFNSSWGLDEKVRNITPYHHSVDAIIISNIYSKSIAEYYVDIVKLLRYYNSEIKYKTKEGKEADAKNAFSNAKKQILDKWDDNKNLHISKYHKDNLIKLIEVLESNIKTSKIKNSKISDYSNIYLVSQIYEIDKKIDSLIPIKLIQKDKLKVWNILHEIESEIKSNKKDNEKDNKEIDLIDFVISQKKSEITEMKFLNRFNKEQLSEIYNNSPVISTIIDEKKWAKENKRNVIDFPYPSYKIERKIKNSFLGSETPDSIKKVNDKVKKKYKDFDEIKENKKELLKRYKNIGYIQDKHNNLWNTDSYYGFRLNNGKIQYLKNYEVINNNILASKYISRNNTLKINDGSVNIYTGKMGSTVLLKNIYISKNNEKIYKKINTKTWVKSAKSINNIKNFSYNIIGKKIS